MGLVLESVGLVVALSSVIAAGTLIVIAREIRSLRLGKLRKLLVEFLVEGKNASSARVLDARKSDQLLEDLHAVTAFAQFGVKAYDEKLRSGQASAGAPPPAPPIPESGVGAFLGQTPVRVDRPPSDGTSAPG